MEEYKAPILQLFENHYDSSRTIFADLTKKIKSKKAIELEEELFFFQLFLDLLGKIHFEKKELSFIIFSPFEQLYRNLKKVHHIKVVQNQYASSHTEFGINYLSYEKKLDLDKKTIYTEVYEVILAIPLNIWEGLYKEVYHYSKKLTPLMINTASTQIINEEIDFFHFDTKNQLDVLSLKDIYKGLKKIVVLENIRMSTGLNPIFTLSIHSQIHHLNNLLNSWYGNHLFFQHLSHYLSDKEEVNKKYYSLLKHLKKNNKSLTADVVDQCTYLFTKVLH